MRALAEAGKSRLLAVSDISCDVEGSLEFLTQSTLIERPYYNYYPLTTTVGNEIDGKGVVVCGIDILPSELPREASRAFGDALMPLIPSLASSEASDTGMSLPAPLQGAIITSGGRLTQDFQFIDALRKEKEREKKLQNKLRPSKMVAKLPMVSLTLSGHLFDSGLINKTLDVIEGRGGSFHFAEILVQANGKDKNATTVVLNVEAPTEVVLRDIVTRIKTLVSILEVRRL